MICMNLLLLLQSVAGDSLPDLTALAEGVETIQRMNFFDMAVKGGWIMIPLLLLSLVAVYIFIERSIALKKASKENPNFMERIKDYIYDGNIDSAIKLCKQADNPAARMIEKVSPHRSSHARRTSSYRKLRQPRSGQNGKRPLTAGGRSRRSADVGFPGHRAGYGQSLLRYGLGRQ